ncbi:MAG TPA: radical SAM protein [Candidatus Omnitrophota bacterium]|jgi:MoaA/NifB/PqqE/SkfB family radical SAM enzyme|nr:radical SAM protein [Candidatus Omnitrophota bacterium]
MPPASDAPIPLLARGAAPASQAELARAAPRVPFLGLDTVWFQVGGTLCNLQCRHCFIACGPANHEHELMTRDEIRPYLLEAESLGVNDLYFTGGEPFLNRELLGILEDALRIGSATVLTNGTLITEERACALAQAYQASRYSLEVRVSLDGTTPERNDPIRGAGSFDEAMAGVERLAAAGLNPILTVARTWDDDEDDAIRERFHDLLRARGIARPRVKVLPLFLIGRERERTRGYGAEDLLTDEHLRGHDPWSLQCSTSRMVTSRGVMVCPILIDAPDALMGKTLRESMRPHPLAHGACHTCWATGATCRN